jgi:hypothetical protein
VPTGTSAAEPALLSFCEVSRDALPAIADLSEHVARHAEPVPGRQLRREGWDLLPGSAGELMDKIRRAGVPLREYVGAAPLYGIKTGFNEAFLIDQETRDRLVREDPKCEPIIKKFLRGENVRRWHAPWGGEWIIPLASSENRDWPWSSARDERDAAAEAAGPRAVLVGAAVVRLLRALRTAEGGLPGDPVP